ncbi:uncharacterized protein TNIN_392901 [Trichonephila inaurata madagascariensis]|uniref:Uncharacterized protein n=1 Tax=Trichonephila inaurata madagascariensis TaxID=2747483 RepID=A0A8X7BXI0_9ARAC|nr:uncharacterized protein TNIN_392901 [Trichonephila inaurata madagascariensis]
MEVGETRIAGDDGENGMVAGEDQNNMTGDETAGENQNDVGLENLFELVNESAFKSFFNNEQDLCERFTQLPQTIHITRSLNPRIMVVASDE